MAHYSTLRIDLRAPAVVQVTMSRPEVSNAFDETMIAELDTAFGRLAGDPQIRVVVLAAEGRHFSAGADLQWMRRASQATQANNLEDARRFAAMLSRLADQPQPTVARIQGAALGGGLGLACVCDLAIAAQNASFAASEARFGILPSVIGPYLIQAVGRRQATRLALGAARIDAEEARALGIVHRVVPESELDAAIDAAVAELLAGGPRAQREIKTLYRRLRGGAVPPEERELTAQTIARVRATDEAREGFAAFLDKRAPSWTPR